MNLRRYQPPAVTWWLSLSGVLVGVGLTDLAQAETNEIRLDRSQLPLLCPIEIQLSAPALDSLRAEPRKYASAKVMVSKEVFPAVGIHLKGSQGSVRGLEDKPSFTLDFAKYDPVQRFRGLRKIHLNNSVEDLTFLNELIGSEFFGAASVPVPWVTHARVSLNGRELGLYVLKEGFTVEFLTRHFARTDGNFYDIETGHDVDRTMKRSLGRPESAGQPDLERLAAVCAERNLERRWQELHRVLDVESFMAFMAVEMMICHWDGYCLARNNFRIYHDPASDRIIFLPAGMDQLFGKADLPWKPVMAGLVAQAILEVPEGNAQYRARFEKLFAQLYHSEAIDGRIQQRLEGLRPFLTPNEFRSLRTAVAELRSEVEKREQSLRRQLREEPPRLLEFHAGEAALDHWKITEDSTGSQTGEVPAADGKRTLWIHAGTALSTSWRTTIRLPQGQYEFRGDARASNVVALPFGRNQGAALRLSGGTRSAVGLVGTCGWTPLKHRFTVTNAEEEITFLCELRAASGDAWFDKNSLRIIRLP